MTEYDSDTQEFGGTDYQKKDVLLELYWRRDHSSRDIADIFDVCKKTILRWMKKHDIPRRETPTNDVRFYLNNGRQKVALYEDGTDKIVRVARLTAVAEYGFEAVCDNDVHHKNGISWLDHPDNLRVMDPSEHRRHHNLGQNNPNTKLDIKQVKDIKRRLRNNSESTYDIAEDYPISPETVSDINTGQSWSEIEL